MMKLANPFTLDSKVPWFLLAEQLHHHRHASSAPSPSWAPAAATSQTSQAPLSDLDSHCAEILLSLGSAFVFAKKAHSRAPSPPPEEFHELPAADLEDSTLLCASAPSSPPYSPSGSDFAGRFSDSDDDSSSDAFASSRVPYRHPKRRVPKDRAANKLKADRMHNACREHRRKHQRCHADCPMRLRQERERLAQAISKDPTLQDAILAAPAPVSTASPVPLAAPTTTSHARVAPAPIPIINRVPTATVVVSKPLPQPINFTTIPRLPSFATFAAATFMPAH